MIFSSFKPGIFLLLYSADFIVTMDGPVLEGGAVDIQKNKIIGIYGPNEIPPHSQEQIKIFKDTVLMPGLINSHIHLELGWARSLFPPREMFSMWVTRLQKAQETLTPEGIQNAIRLGVLESIECGTTTLVDVGNTPYPLQILPGESVRSVVFQELIGLDPATGLKNFTLKNKGRELFKNNSRRYPLTDTALSIHAPFSCSKKLIRKVADTVEEGAPPFTLHLGESADEWDMFTRSEGRLHELCKKRYPALKPFKETPFQYMIRNHLLPRGSLAVHCNYLDLDAAAFFASQNISIAHCPRSRRFFGHKEFPYEICHNHGINVCLGTDSLGSNESLNLFEEMSQFKMDFPQVDCLEILKMATVNGARALGRSSELGKLKEGFLADMIGINLKHDRGFDIVDEIVNEEFDVNLVVVNGLEVMV